MCPPRRQGASSSSAPAPGQPLNAGGPESEAGGEQAGRGR